MSFAGSTTFAVQPSWPSLSVGEPQRSPSVGDVTHSSPGLPRRRHGVAALASTIRLAGAAARGLAARLALGLLPGSCGDGREGEQAASAATEAATTARFRTKEVTGPPRDTFPLAPRVIPVTSP